MSLQKPEVILTHESDLDGFVSGLLLKELGRQFFDCEVRLEAYHSDAWKQRSMKENAAWVSDFTFESRMDKTGWMVIDHHPTRITAKNALLKHHPEKSASLLCYELCKSQGIESARLERLVHLSNVADLFLVNDPQFELAMDYASMVKTYQFWNLYALVKGKLENLWEHPLLEVMATKRRIEDPIGLAWSKENISRISPTVGFVDTVVGNTNLVVHQLLEKQLTPYSVLMTLIRKGNGTVVASLRSRNGEALKLAELLQGGGHANAAGATLPRSVQRIPDALDYLRKLLQPKPVTESPAPGVESLFDEIESPRG